MLRLYKLQIIAGLLLLVISSPCELFPAMVWRFVTDDIVLQGQTSPWLLALFGFGGHVTGRLGLLVSSTGWLLVIYLIGEVLRISESSTVGRISDDGVVS